MAKDPAVLFYTSDFLTGTAFFNMEQRGQYITLLCEQHQNGHIPENHMINICNSYDSPVIKKFIVDDKGLYYNERMKKEKDRRVKYCKSRSNNKSGRPKNKSYGNHMTTHMETATETDTIDVIDTKNINIPFSDFWDQYDKKVGKRSKIEKKWNLLTDDKRTLTMEHIIKYKQSQPDKTYRKNPETYLNNEGWNDEVIIKLSEQDILEKSYREMLNEPATA